MYDSIKQALMMHWYADIVKINLKYNKKSKCHQRLRSFLSFHFVLHMLAFHASS